MDFESLFEQFWNDSGYMLTEMGINNKSRAYENLQDKMADFHNIAEIDEYVCSLKTRRESTRKIVVAFFEYLSSLGYDTGDSVLRKKKFYDYPFERQLEIAKFLHKPRTAAEIEERFDISERTRRDDLQDLEEGIEVLGSTIRIRKERKHRKDYYRSTLHPVFLPLNLTEVYALTVYLDRAIDRRDPNSEMIRNISDRVKSQLSEYAIEKLFPEESYRFAENSYVDDESLARQREGIRMYLMKSGQPCKFMWEEEEYMGRIRYREGEYYIELMDGGRLDADVNEVDFIIESLEYK